MSLETAGGFVHPYIVSRITAVPLAILVTPAFRAKLSTGAADFRSIWDSHLGRSSAMMIVQKNQAANLGWAINIFGVIVRVRVVVATHFSVEIRATVVGAAFFIGSIFVYYLLFRTLGEC
jgi:hypothetical protein